MAQVPANRRPHRLKAADGPACAPAAALRGAGRSSEAETETQDRPGCSRCRRRGRIRTHRRTRRGLPRFAFLTEDVDINPADRPSEHRPCHCGGSRGSPMRGSAPTWSRTACRPVSTDSLAAVQTWNLTTAAGDLDLSFEPAGTRGYSDLRRDAEPAELYGGDRADRLAGRRDPVEAGRTNRLKDQRVADAPRDPRPPFVRWSVGRGGARFSAALRVEVVLVRLASEGQRVNDGDDRRHFSHGSDALSR